MKITIIIAAILFTYGVFSTAFHTTDLVGDIGKTIGETNVYLFGYFAYIDFFAFLYPLYRLYSKEAKRKDPDFYNGWMLFLISSIMFSSLVLEPENRGYIGDRILDTLEPLIGIAGMWLFVLMTTLLSLSFSLSEDIKAGWEKIDKEKVDRIASGAILSMANAARKTTNLIMRPFEKNDAPDEMLQDMYCIPGVAQAPKEPKKEERKPTETEKNQVSEKEDEYPDPDAPSISKVEIESPILDEIKEMEQGLENIGERRERPRGGKITKKSGEKPGWGLSDKRETKEGEPETQGKNVVMVKELETNAKLMNDTIEKGKVAKPKNFKLPKMSFLQKPMKTNRKINEAEIDSKIEELLSKLLEFKIEGDVVRTYSGPLVTTFEFKPAPNVKVSKILNLQDDLAMALSAETIRIQAPIPGRDVVGIEIPNEIVDTIYLREILESDLFRKSSSPLTVALGKDIVGNPFITDIKKLPHLLIAGTTGSGKSVGINAMILSLLYRNDPENLKLMLIDPKMLEFSIYNDIPHLITPVITDPKKAIAALANMVGEMERRYKLMANNKTKNIDNYNEKVAKDKSADPFPFIVVVIDELADLMMNGGKEVEFSIARLAQMARACGIHLIVATQRPSVDVVTGLIKANLPSRLSYRVGQKIDSKVILDTMGAESLLGRGDGLFTPPGATGLVRLHAPWNTEEEIEEIVNYIKAQREPDYDESYLVTGGVTADNVVDSDIELDPMYEEAKEVVLSDNKTSISYLQRKLGIGYNRSANIIEQLEQTGVLSAPNAKGNREVL